jgi:hypothetical protein
MLKSDGALIDFLLHKIEKMRDFETYGDSVSGIIANQSSIAFRARGDDFLYGPFFNGFYVKSSKSHEILLVTGPQQVMAATSFAGEDCRVDVEEIEETKSVRKNVTGSDLKMMFEIGVEIGCATPEEEGLALGIHLDVFGQPVPVAHMEVFGSHGPHERLEEPSMSLRFMSTDSARSLQTAHIANELRKIHRRWTTIITKAAGEAGPYVGGHSGRENGA